MPIRFEQPSPMAPQTSIDAGRAHVATQDFPSIVSMYDAANRNQLAASQASASLGIQASAQTAHNAEQSLLAGNAMRQQQQQFAASQYPSARDEFVAQQHYQAQQQQMAMQQWLMDQDLSQKEQMQMQVAQAGLATVLGDPTVTPEEKQEAMRLYQQHINPLKVRQERMQAKRQQQQVEQIAHANAQAETMQQQDMAFAAGNLDKLPLVTDPETGKGHRMLRDKNGKWYDPFEASHKAKDVAAEQQFKEQERVAKEAFQEREHEADQQRKDYESYITHRQKLEDAAAKDVLLPADQKDTTVAAKMKAMGMAPDVATHVKERAAERKAMRHPPTNMQAPPVPTPPGVAPPPGAAPPAATAAPAAVPAFTETKAERLKRINDRLAQIEAEQERAARAVPTLFGRPLTGINAGEPPQ